MGKLSKLKYFHDCPEKQNFFQEITSTVVRGCMHGKKILLPYQFANTYVVTQKFPDVHVQ